MNATDVFFINNTMSEVACEPVNTCDVDQRSFKAYTSRFMALTIKMAPWTAGFIMPKLQTSAKAAARHCSYGEDKNTCGMIWTQDGWDNKYGVGEQLCALETIQNNLVDQVGAPVTQANGGTSRGNPSAGAGGDASLYVPSDYPTTKKDKIGAGFLTAFVIILLLATGYFMIV